MRSTQTAAAAAGERGRAARRPRAVPALAVAALALALAVLVPSAAQAACGRLPVRVSLPDGPYAATYAKQMRVRVAPDGGAIHDLRVYLYTFTGRRMGVSRQQRVVSATSMLSLVLEPIFRPLQIGGFTLVVTGEAGAGCGLQKTTRVLKFVGCQTTLPVTFPKLPGGLASDYEGYLSVPIRSDGPLIRDVTSAIYGFDGRLLGRAPSLPALFGEQTLDHALLSPLQPGRYNVIVSGRIDDQPSSCGRKTAQATMTFK
jgi:hypothetical protein